MTIIKENSVFSLSRYKDTFYLENKSTINNLKILILEMNCGEPADERFQIDLSPSEIKEINFVYDAEFGFYIEDSDEAFTTVKFFLKTLENIISRAESVLCDCGCEDCNDDSECKIRLDLLSLLVSFFNLNQEEYRNPASIVSKSVACLFTNNLMKMSNDMTYSGKVDNDLFIKRLVSYYYLVFYIHESLLSTDKEEALYVKNKYNYSTIKKCIENLGINPDNIIEEILSGMVVSYWQFGDVVSDINTVKLSWSPTYINSLAGVLDRPLEDFEEGIVVPYTKIGRIGFSITPSPLLNFSIYDSLGNDVTHNFEVHYFNNEQSAVYVSKVPYSISNIYFKFKKNIYV